MISVPDYAHLKPGFADPVLDSQRAFRTIMSAIAYPGRIVTIGGSACGPSPLSPATTAFCLTLADGQTPIWLDVGARGSEIPTYLQFHCGARIVDDPGAAQFAIIVDAVAAPRLHLFDAGEDEYPDRSATMCLQVASLTDGAETRWSGPGIEHAIFPRVTVPDWFWSDWLANAAAYPKGIDVVFTCGDAAIALPRTVKVEA